MEIAESEDVALRLETLPVSRLRSRARTLVGAGAFFNAVDGLALASVLPVLNSAWGLSLSQSGFLISAGYGGQLVGAFLGGWAAERFGRLAAIAWTIGIFSLLSLMCMLSWGYWPLLIFRAVQGLGLGAAMPVSAVYLNELAAARNRGRFLLFYEWSFPIGRIAVALAGLAIVARFGWRYLFLLGGAPVLLALALPKFLPESPRWLAAKGRITEAVAALQWMEGESGRPTKIERYPSRTTMRTDWRDLFRGIYLSRTMVAWALWFTAFWVINGLSNWIPTLYRTVFHIPVQTALQYGLITNFASLAGCFAAAMLIDWTGRRLWFCIALSLGGAAFLALWLLRPATAMPVLILSCVGSACVNSVTVSLYLHTAEIYPTRLRALGVGVASAWMRVSSIVCGSVIGLTVQHYGLNTVFLQLAAMCVVGAPVAWLFCVESQGRVLEDLSP
jgi:MFS transporter, putative metabolite:H+ symporter